MPVLDHGGIGRIEFDQQRIALQPIGYHAGRACACERVEHGAPARTSGLDARLDQVGRESGEMSFAEGMAGDFPDAALVAGFARFEFVGPSCFNPFSRIPISIAIDAVSYL